MWLYAICAPPLSGNCCRADIVKSGQSAGNFLAEEEGPQSRQSAKLFLQSSELGLPHPSPAGECAPPPFDSWGGGGTLACRKGVGESQFRRGDIHCGTLYIYVLCGRDTSKCRSMEQPPTASYLSAKKKHFLFSITQMEWVFTVNSYRHCLADFVYFWSMCVSITPSRGGVFSLFMRITWVPSTWALSLILLSLSQNKSVTAIYCVIRRKLLSPIGYH